MKKLYTNILYNKCNFRRNGALARPLRRCSWIIIGVLVGNMLFSELFAQEISNKRAQWVSTIKDTILLDTLSIIPGSVKVKYRNNQRVDSTRYRVNYLRSKLIWIINPADSIVMVNFRVFPYDLSAPVQLRKAPVKGKSRPGKYLGMNAYLRKFSGNQKSDYGYEELRRNGGISRGIVFGNNQDLALNSNLDLQLSGKLSEEVRLKAVFTDQNLPIQPEGNSAQLQDFDKVFVELSTRRNKLTLGDFEMKNNRSNYLLKFHKKTQGIGATRSWNPAEGKQIKAGANIGLSRGQYSRKTFNGREGDQGPYRLTGAKGERFIIVVSGTERVYLNGKRLKRGAQNDYVIDYNKGELTFTPENMISQYDRIVVEFQYANRQYERSVIHGFWDYNKDRWSFRAGLYSQQDHKNRLLFGELQPGEKQILSRVGDSTGQAVVPSVDSLEYSSERIMYKQVDTLGFSDVFVHSADPEKAHYVVLFNYVGQGNGNYREQITAANGKVFKWVKPFNGEPQGSYSPVDVLIAPEKKQMATFQTSYKTSGDGKAGVEVALSNRDVNTFSVRHSGDDKGLATRLFFNENFRLSSSEKPWKLKTGANYEYKSKQFRSVERYRPVEFERTWKRQISNPQKASENLNENLGSLNLGISKPGLLDISYRLGSYIKQQQFDGLQHQVKGNLEWKKYRVSVHNEWTRADESPKKPGGKEKQFLYQKGKLSREVGAFEVGGIFKRESGKHHLSGVSLLQDISFRYNSWKVFVKTHDTTAKQLNVYFKQRNDFTPLAGKFARITKFNEFKFQTHLLQDHNRKIRWSFTYRDFQTRDTVRKANRPSQTILNRMEFDYRILDGLFETSTFYQVGTGNERKNRYEFVKLRSQGQGNYVWNDYNENGQKELDEFVPANENNQFKANYIRIITPSSRFVRSVENQFNQSLNFRPEALWEGDHGLTGFLSDFSNLTSLRINRKTLDDKSVTQFNPFLLDVKDSSLVNIGSVLRNSLYYRKNDPQFGLEYTWEERKRKALLFNGFDTYYRNENLFRLRWNMNRYWSLNPQYAYGFNKFNSTYFNSKDYSIVFWSSEARLAYQPSGKFRSALFYRYESQQNRLKEKPLASKKHKITGEVTFGFAGRGALTGNLSYITIIYKGKTGTPVAYELLKGLQPGSNFTWNVLFNYNLQSNIQVNMVYNGRKSSGEKVFHSFNVNVRYLF